MDRERRMRGKKRRPDFGVASGLPASPTDGFGDTTSIGDYCFRSRIAARLMRRRAWPASRMTLLTGASGTKSLELATSSFFAQACNCGTASFADVPKEPKALMASTCPWVVEV